MSSLSQLENLKQSYELDRERQQQLKALAPFEYRVTNWLIGLMALQLIIILGSHDTFARVIALLVSISCLYLVVKTQHRAKAIMASIEG